MKTLRIEVSDSLAEAVATACQKHGISVADFMKRAMHTQIALLTQFPKDTAAPLADGPLSAALADILRRLG